MKALRYIKDLIMPANVKILSRPDVWGEFIEKCPHPVKNKVKSTGFWIVRDQLYSKKLNLVNVSSFYIPLNPKLFRGSLMLVSYLIFKVLPVII